MGMGFLSKPVELLQLLCWAVFFVLWPPARKHLRRPGPYLALVVHLVCALQVLVWNYLHGWITVSHIADDAGAHNVWHPTLKYLGDFLGVEFAVLNPVFFVAVVWAAIGMWRRGRQNPRLIYFSSMGAPVFLAFMAHSFRSRVLPNWIAPSIVPLFCVMVIYWDARWRLGSKWLKPWLACGLALGLPVVLVLHNTDLIAKVTHRDLAVNRDPLHRVRDWDTTARTVGQVRQELLAEGKPVFIITEHYGIAGQISFYLPEARAAVRGTALVYRLTSTEPRDQFFFWPGYGERKGENAVYVRELDRYNPTPGPPPERLMAEFETVTDLGVRNVYYHGNQSLLLRPLQFFACRNLK
jgi:hypothetical protein